MLAIAYCLTERHTRESKDFPAYTTSSALSFLHGHIEAATAVVTTLALSFAVWLQVRYALGLSGFLFFINFFHICSTHFAVRCHLSCYFPPKPCGCG